MKTRFNSHSEICHYWANNDYQASGNASSIFFRGDTIYSYGTHFPLAKKIRDKKGVVTHLLVNENYYSNSTSKHQSHLRGAISHFYTIDCQTDIEDFNPVAEIRAQIESIKDSLDSFSRARTLKAYHVEQIEKRLNTISIIRENSRVESRLKKSEKDFLQNVENDMEQMAVDAEAERAKRNKKAIAAFDEKLEKWRNFETHWLGDDPRDRNRAYLRLDMLNEEVQTSKQVKVHFDEAMRLIDLIDKKNIIGARVNDSFTVTAFNGVFKAGCHTIPTSEITETISHLKNLRA